MLQDWAGVKTCLYPAGRWAARQMSWVLTQDKSPDLSTPLPFLSKVILSWLAGWLQQCASPRALVGQPDTVRGEGKGGNRTRNEGEGGERCLLGQLPLAWGAVALGARFTCDKGGCHGRAGERNNKHSRWETKAGQPPTHKYGQGRPTSTSPTAGATCLKAGKGVRRGGPVSG